MMSLKVGFLMGEKGNFFIQGFGGVLLDAADNFAINRAFDLKVAGLKLLGVKPQ